MQVYRIFTHRRFIEKHKAFKLSTETQVAKDAWTIIQDANRRLRAKGIAVFENGDAVKHYMRPLKVNYDMGECRFNKASTRIRMLGYADYFVKRPGGGKYVTLWGWDVPGNLAETFEDKAVVKRAKIQNNQAIMELENLDVSDILAMGYGLKELEEIQKEIQEKITLLKQSAK